jgi:hypothetical protein
LLVVGAPFDGFASGVQGKSGPSGKVVSRVLALSQKLFWCWLGGAKPHLLFFSGFYCAAFYVVS